MTMGCKPSASSVSLPRVIERYLYLQQPGWHGTQSRCDKNCKLRRTLKATEQKLKAMHPLSFKMKGTQIKGYLLTYLLTLSARLNC